MEGIGEEIDHRTFLANHSENLLFSPKSYKEIFKVLDFIKRFKTNSEKWLW
jgi:hypothetical protein